MRKIENILLQYWRVFNLNGEWYILYFLCIINNRIVVFYHGDSFKDLQLIFFSRRLKVSKRNDGTGGVVCEGSKQSLKSLRVKWCKSSFMHSVIVYKRKFLGSFYGSWRLFPYWTLTSPKKKKNLLSAFFDPVKVFIIDKLHPSTWRILSTSLYSMTHRLIDCACWIIYFLFKYQFEL